jgi:mutator protein MutT
METSMGETPKNSTLNVAAAIIEHKYRYLILKRAVHKENAGLWEFPGGKLMPGESLKQCVEREIAEELGVKAAAGACMASVEETAGDKTIRLFGLKTVIDKEPTTLKDHTEFQWVRPERLSNFALTAPDVALLHKLLPGGASEREIIRLNAWSMAKIYGVIYALVGVFLGAFLMVLPQAISSMGQFTFGQKLFTAISLPFIHFILGAATGAMLALGYNVVAFLFGGFKMRLR